METTGGQLMYKSAASVQWEKCSFVAEGAIQINVKPGHWFSKEEQSSKFRPQDSPLQDEHVCLQLLVLRSARVTESLRRLFSAISRRWFSKVVLKIRRISRRVVLAMIIYLLLIRGGVRSLNWFDDIVRATCFP